MIRFNSTCLHSIFIALVMVGCGGGSSASNEAPSALSSTSTSVAATPTATELTASVIALPVDSTERVFKRQILSWSLSAADQLLAAGDTTGAANLRQDVATALPVEPAKLPAPSQNLFPSLPSFASNPFVTATLKSVKAQLISDTAQPVSITQDYPSFEDAIRQTRLGSDMIALLLHSDAANPYARNVNLLPSILNRADSIFRQIRTGGARHKDFGVAAEAPFLYLQLTSALPGLIPPSRQAVWLDAIRQNTEAIAAEQGAHLQRGRADIASMWINADVRWLAALAFGGIALNEKAKYAPMVAGGLEQMQIALYPDGGTAYTDFQNEAFSYHSVYAWELARYTMVTGDSTGNTLAAGTRNYYPLSFTVPGVGEYATAPAWKKYWNPATGADGMAIVVGLTGDPLNAWQLSQVAPPANLFIASFYRPDVVPKAIPDNWMTYDRNTQGTRGQFGRFTVASTTRSTEASLRGKASYVGAMALDAGTKGWTLNAALEAAGNQVLLARGAELVGAKDQGAQANLQNLAQNEHNANLTTAQFGALSTVHKLSGYGKKATSWTGVQSWLLLPTRVIGLVQMSNTAPETAVELSGSLKLVSARNNWGMAKSFQADGAGGFSYGKLMAKVFAHDYVNISTELTGVWQDAGQGGGWIKLEDARNTTVGNKTYPAGTSHYYLAEVRPDTAAVATNVSRLQGLPAGLAGFSFTDSDGKTYTLVHTLQLLQWPTPRPPPQSLPVVSSSALYGCQQKRLSRPPPTTQA